MERGRPLTRAAEAAAARQAADSPARSLSAGFKYPHVATQASEDHRALHAPPRELVAGEAHPLLHLANGFELHHSCLAAKLRVPLCDDIAVYDATTGELVFAPPQNSTEDFVLQLPVTFALPGGDSFTIKRWDELLRRDCIKFDTASGCSCAATGRFVAQKRCEACSTRVTALVKRIGLPPATLADAGYVASAETAVREVLELLLLSATGAEPEGRVLLPSHFALARPGGKSLKNAMSEADAGYSSDHPHAGFRAASAFACGFPRADGTPCGCMLWVRVKDAEPTRLYVHFECKEHRHGTGFCPHTGQPCASECLSRGLHPIVQPTGVPPRLYAAALLVTVQSWLQGRDAGVPTAPAAVLRGAVNLAAPLVCLCRDETRFGTSRSWEDALRLERLRVQLRLGVLPPTPIEAGGPTTRVGKNMEQIHELFRSPQVKDNCILLTAVTSPIEAYMVTTPFRLELYAATETVERSKQSGSFIDMTGGIVEENGVKYMNINVVKMLPAASGGGRFVILSVVTNTKRELAFKMTMDALVNWMLLEKGIKLQPAFVTSDQDLATRNAVCYALNGCSLKDLRLRLHTAMLEAAHVLMEHDLLGKPLDVNNPPDFPLPYPGFELASDGTVMPTPVDGVTLPLLCTSHFGRTDHDHILHSGVDFKHLAIHARHFYVHLSACFLYPALSSPLFSGMHTYPFLLMYQEEVEAILSLGPVLPVGEVFDGFMLRAYVREATAEDQKPKRKPFTHVFEALIKGIESPICKVRIRGTVGDAEQEVELDMPPEAANMVRAVHLGALPKAADAYADVPTEELDQQEGYVRPEDAEPAGSGSDSESEEAEPESVPLPAPLDGDGAGCVYVLHPLHLERKMKKETRLPLVLSWKLRTEELMFASPTFRKDLPQLVFKGNTDAPVEGSFDDMKHTDREIAGKKGMPLVPFLAAQANTMMAEDKATATTRLAGIGDPTKRRQVQNTLNSRAGAASAAAAAAAAPGAAAPAKGKAKKPPVATGDIISIRGGDLSDALAHEALSPWGSKRKPRPAGTDDRAPPMVLEARPSLLDAMRSSRRVVGPAARFMSRMDVSAVDHHVDSLRRAQVGSGSAAEVKKTEKAAADVMKAHAALHEKLKSFYDTHATAVDKTAKERREAGAIATPGAPPQWSKPIRSSRATGAAASTPRSPSAPPAMRR